MTGAGQSFDPASLLSCRGRVASRRVLMSVHAGRERQAGMVVLGFGTEAVYNAL